MLMSRLNITNTMTMSSTATYGETRNEPSAIPPKERCGSASTPKSHSAMKTNAARPGNSPTDVKNAFHTALGAADVTDFTWHDLRHTFASWLIMKGASLRSVAELLGHRGLRMVMRYAHLSPAYLSAEVGLLDAPQPAAPPPRGERARKGQTASKRDRTPAKVVEFPKGIGSSGWIRTNNPPVNSRMLCH